MMEFKKRTRGIILTDEHGERLLSELNALSDRDLRNAYSNESLGWGIVQEASDRDIIIAHAFRERRKDPFPVKEECDKKRLAYFRNRFGPGVKLP